MGEWKAGCYVMHRVVSGHLIDGRRRDRFPPQMGISVFYQDI